MATKKTTKKKSLGGERFTTSKKIVFASYVIGVALTIVTLIGGFKGLDVSSISMVTSVAYAEIAASNAFYFWKAKKENAMKIALAAVKETPTEQVDDIVKLVNAMGGIV